MRKYIRLHSCTVREDRWEPGSIVEVNAGQARLSGTWFDITDEWEYEEIGEVIIVGSGEIGHHRKVHLMELIKSHGQTCSFLTPEELNSTGLKADINLDEVTPPSPPPLMEIFPYHIMERIDYADEVYIKPSVNPMDRNKGGRKKGKNKFGR